MKKIPFVRTVLPSIFFFFFCATHVLAAINNVAGYVGVNTVGPFQTVEVTGNVGIGSVNPAEALDVSGNVRMSGSLIIDPLGTSTGVDSYTKLLLRADGADAATSFIDTSLSPVTVTTAGHAQIDTAQFKFGGSSALFDGSGDYLTFPDSADFQVGNGDFTIDAWIRTAAISGNAQYILADYNGAGSQSSIVIDIDHPNWPNKFRAGIMFTDSSYIIPVHQTSISANTWYHVAIVRSGPDVDIYVNGVKGSTTYNAGTKSVRAIQSSGNWSIGRAGDANVFFYNGWIDEFRFSKGIARWTNSFIPPGSSAKLMVGTIDHSGNAACIGAGNCLGYCTAGTYPACTTCNCL